MKTESHPNPYTFTFDRIQIEAQFCGVKISVEGLDLWTRQLPASSPKMLHFWNFRGDKAVPVSAKPLTEYSVRIQTIKALTHLTEGLRNIKQAKNRPIEIPLSVLKIMPDINAKQLSDLLEFFPKVTELVLVSNPNISLLSILDIKGLQKLTIQSAIYLDPGERDLILQAFPKINLKIVLCENIYRIDYPSSASLAAYALFLVFICGVGIYMLDSAEKEIIQHSNGHEYHRIPIRQLLPSLMLVIGATVAILKLISFVAKINQNQYREITRKEPIIPALTAADAGLTKL